MWVLVVVVAFVLASCSSSDTSSEPVDPNATTLAGTDGLDATTVAWCALEQPPYELDPEDPASVEAGFTQTLAFDLLRAENPPMEIADDLQTLVEETERVIGILEQNGWDLLSEEVEPQLVFPPEAQRAADTVHRFEVDVCGLPDDRDPGDG